ncbi:MAG: YceI family protein [Actinomycetota bacterium]|nr:YceI family protein [Actinomycetota bacterium]
MTTAVTGIYRGRQDEPAPPVVPAGGWQVDPLRSTAAFTARLAGRSIRGRLPLMGRAIVTPSIEDSTAQLIAMTDAVSTGNRVIDRLLTGPAFLDAGVFPEISFQSEILVCVPNGWRAVGQLAVKGSQYPMVAELDVDLRHARSGGATMILTSRWVLDSSWITTQRVTALSRRVVMTCSVALDHSAALEE